jgi:hypothetical protein
MEAEQLSKAKLTGPWSIAEIEAYLRDAIIPIRLSAISPSGWPVVVSLWYDFDTEMLWCASQRKARIIKLLEAKPRCGFEIAAEQPPYFGVRGQGLADVDDSAGSDVLRRLADRYLGADDTPFRRWLLERDDEEVAIAIRPVRLMSWDYRDRMSKAD